MIATVKGVKGHSNGPAPASQSRGDGLQLTNISCFEQSVRMILYEVSTGMVTIPVMRPRLSSARILAPYLEKALKELQKVKPSLLPEERYKKFRKMGVFEKA